MPRASSRPEGEDQRKTPSPPNPAPVVNTATNKFSLPTNLHPEVADDGNREQLARRPRIPPFFVKTRPDWHSILTLIRQEAPSMTAAMSRGHFFKITVQTEQEHLKLKHFLIDQGFDFKCFSLKSEKRGFPSCTDNNLSRLLSVI
ncbi:hypothetical protein CEXT_143591 [Caerostris extrusa]|uniref:Uncharacterized protein n=1 Tax=Caerostris extrusa TaxID=172846 RepID=A0AAV4NB95_CAEEX|nr:hypothetical protein CEXT_143591 [Caerostris extrusa]